MLKSMNLPPSVNVLYPTIKRCLGLFGGSRKRQLEKLSPKTCKVQSEPVFNSYLARVSWLCNQQAFGQQRNSCAGVPLSSFLLCAKIIVIVWQTI